MVLLRLSRFQSTHPVGGGTREWSDGGTLAADFNPPTPWGVGLQEQFCVSHIGLFQSTHPVGGGTIGDHQRQAVVLFQSTHPVGGGTPGGQLRPVDQEISIHPPRGGWDLAINSRFRRSFRFQSTHPVGGGTLRSRRFRRSAPISIHPPRGGWDVLTHGPGGKLTISIHPPRGGWDQCCDFLIVLGIISIHPPRGGWDRSGWWMLHTARHFNPPTPWGVGLPLVSGDGLSPVFQSTHPVGGGTRGHAPEY